VLFAAALVAASLVVAAAPAVARESAKAKSSATTYVGTVKGLGSLAIVVDKDGGFGYLCDSAAVSEWFKGTNDGGKLDLESPNGTTLAAAVKSKLLDGVLVQPDGTATNFKLKPAKGRAGLFRAEQLIDGIKYAAGWVRLANGKTDGKVTAVPTATGTPVVSASVVQSFPTNPTPGDQVTVVPFSSGQTTSEGSGGGGNQASEPGGGGNVTTTTVPLPFCKDVGQLEQEIAALNASLADAPLLKIRAIKQQIGRLQQELTDAQRGLNCTLPLK
jgi:hypothetical protein